MNQACSISPHTWFLCYLNFLCLCLFLFHKCEPGLFHFTHTWFLCYLNFLCLCLCAISPHTWFLCYLNFLCLCLFLFRVNQVPSHRKLGSFHLTAISWFLCYLNFLCLCLFLFHKCEPGLFHLTAHLVPLLFEFLI